MLNHSKIFSYKIWHFAFQFSKTIKFSALARKRKCRTIFTFAWFDTFKVLVLIKASPYFVKAGAVSALKCFNIVFVKQTKKLWLFASHAYYIWRTHATLNFNVVSWRSVKKENMKGYWVKNLLLQWPTSINFCLLSMLLYIFLGTWPNIQRGVYILNPRAAAQKSKVSLLLGKVLVITRAEEHHHMTFQNSMRESPFVNREMNFQLIIFISELWLLRCLWAYPVCLFFNRQCLGVK